MCCAWGAAGAIFAYLLAAGSPRSRDRREVVAVDEVVRDARVVGILLVERLEDRDRLQERLHRLVIERLVQRERVEDLGLDVLGILLRQRFHRIAIAARARFLVDRIVALVVDLDRRDPVALARALGADRFAFLDVVESALQRGGVERADQRVWPIAHGEAPIRDRAVGIGLQRRVERIDRLGKVERMEHRERALEVLLRGGRARRLEQHAAETTGLRVLEQIVVMGGRGPGRQRGQHEHRPCETNGSHGVLPLSKLSGKVTSAVGSRKSSLVLSL